MMAGGTAEASGAAAMASVATVGHAWASVAAPYTFTTLICHTGGCVGGSRECTARIIFGVVTLKVTFLHIRKPPSAI